MNLLKRLAAKVYLSLCHHEILCVIVIMFFRPLYFIDNSYWLDEGTTLWAISGSFQEIVPRVYSTQGHSPLYFQFLWIVAHYFGFSELSLRLPSVISVVLAAVIIFWLVKNISKSAAWFLLFLLFLEPELLRAAISARPYGMSLLFSALTIAAVFSKNKIALPLFLLTIPISILLNTFSILQLPIYVALILTFRTDKLNFFLALCFSTLAAILLLTEQLIFLHASAGIGVIAPLPLDYFIGRFIGQKETLFYCLFGIWFLIYKRVTQTKFMDSRYNWGLLFYPVSTIPYFTLLILSVITGTVVLYPRYFLLGTIAGHVSLAFVLSLLLPKYLKQISISIYIAIALISSTTMKQVYEEDWKSAASFLQDKVSSSDTVFLLSGLMQSKELFRFKDGEQLNFLSNPFLYYYPNKIIVMPGYYQNAEIRDFSIARLKQFRSRRFFIIGRQAEVLNFQLEILTNSNECQEIKPHNNSPFAEITLSECAERRS